MQTTSDDLNNLANRKEKKNKNLMKLFGRGFLDSVQRGINYLNLMEV